MKRTILIFSALVVALLTLFQLGKYSILSGSLQIELFIAAIAIIFFIIGVYLNKKSLQKRRSQRPEAINYVKIEHLGLSNREYEIKQAKLESEKELFMNPVVSFIVMSMTVFVIGFIVSLISALILQHKK